MSEEEVSEAKKSKPGVRGRRGFSKKSSVKANGSHEISESSAVYTTRVAKCFTSLASHDIDESIKEALRDNLDVEDDVCTTKTREEEEKRKRKPTATAVTEPQVLTLSDDEDIKLTPENTSNNDLNNSAIKSRSPTPPPEPSLKNGPTKNRRMKRNVKKAVASLTQSLSAAESQLQNAVYNPTPDKNVYIIDEDEEITVRVDIGGQIHRFTVVVDDPFSKLISEIAVQEKVDDSNIMLVHNDRTIRSHDFPKSIGLRTVDIIKCHIRNSCSDSFNESLSFDTDESNLIEIVVQSKHSRQKEIIKTLPDRPLLAVMKEYSNRVQKDLSQMKFWFDGDSITGNSTPLDLDMEDGDILDMQLL